MWGGLRGGIELRLGDFVSGGQHEPPTTSRYFVSEQQKQQKRTKKKNFFLTDFCYHLSVYPLWTRRTARPSQGPRLITFVFRWATIDRSMSSNGCINVPDSMLFQHLGLGRSVGPGSVPSFKTLYA